MNENYPSNVHQPSEEVVDVEIASAGSRIVAYLLNTLLTILVYMPLFFAVLWPLMPLLSADMSEQEMENALATVEWGGIGIAFGLLVLLVYTVVQCWMMSKHGQSIGKRIMKIRLLKTDGTNPGFWYAVMVREVGFNIVLGLASTVAAYLLAFVAGRDSLVADYIANSLSFIVWLVCLAMMFEPKKNRRTLQDYFANTVVVRVPER